MISLSQIYAIVALLLAFNVPINQVNDIKTMLEQSNSVAISAPIENKSAPQAVASIEEPVSPIQVVDNRILLRSNKQGWFVNAITNIELSKIEILDKDQNVLASSTAQLNNTYSDGNHNYVTYFTEAPTEYIKGDSITLYIKLIAENGATFTSDKKELKKGATEAQ